MNKLLPEWTPELINFIARRSEPYLEPHKSLSAMLAGAYMQGMSDAVEAIRKVDTAEWGIYPSPGNRIMKKFM